MREGRKNRSLGKKTPCLQKRDIERLAAKSGRNGYLQAEAEKQKNRPIKSKWGKDHERPAVGNWGGGGRTRQQEMGPENVRAGPQRNKNGHNWHVALTKASERFGENRGRKRSLLRGIV